MALTVQQGTVALSTTANGDVTVSLPAGFDLKAVGVQAVGATADEQVGKDITFPRGWGTNFGGAIQQVYTTGFSKDGSASIDAARGANSTAILKGYSAGNATVSYAVTLQAFTATSFTLRSVTAPATAIRVQYLALGGSDIEAACAFQFLQATAVATQDVTVATGFGKPSLLVLDHSGSTAAGDATSHWRVGRGAAVPGTGYQSNHQTKDGAATGEIASYVTGNLIGTITSGAAVDGIADLPADQTAAPADGFRLAWSDQSSLTYVMNGLAIRGSADFKPAVVTSTASTGAAGATTTLAGVTGSTAKGALLFGNTEAASATIVTGATGLGGTFSGFTDGTNHGAMGVTQEDANAAAVNGAFDTTTQAIRFATAAAAPATQSEATASLSGANVVLTWGDTDTVARVFHAVVFGSSAATGVEHAADGVTTGGSATTGSVGLIHPGDGTTAGGSVSTATASLTVGVDATTTGGSTSTGEVTVTVAADATTTGSSTSTATAGVVAAGTGTTTGSSGSTADGTTTLAVDGSTTGGSATTGDVGLITPVDGSTTGGSVTTGSTSLTIGAAGSSAGDSISSGTVRADMPLAGASTGNSTTQGTLTLTQPGDGLTAGGSATTGDVLLTLGVAAVTNGSSTTLGNVTGTTNHTAVGVTQGASTSTATPSLTLGPTGLTGGSSTSTATASHSVALTASSTGGSTTLGEAALAARDVLITGGTAGTSDTTGGTIMSLSLTGASIVGGPARRRVRVGR